MPVHDWTRVIAATFHDFHVEWITSIKHALNRGLLPGDYYAMAEQVTGDFGPQVLTLERPKKSRSKPREHGRGIAVLDAPPKVQFRMRGDMDYYSRKARSVTIRHASDHEVIAMIEIVSPGNKSGSDRLHQFALKARSALHQGIHLLIVDLFPPNKRNPNGIHPVIWDELTINSLDEGPAFKLPSGKPLTLASYVGGSQPEAFIEPTAVGLSLIDMPVFLTQDQYVLLPLENTYQSAFREVPSIWRQELELARKGSRRRGK